jgi:hypothetical protein
VVGGSTPSFVVHEMVHVDEHLVNAEEDREMDAQEHHSRDEQVPFHCRRQTAHDGTVHDEAIHSA